jgi:hypothetical protein
VKVTFKHWGHNLASSRYRSVIPAQQLQKMGVFEGRDWLIIGKHGWDWKETEGYAKVCFDVCDDHFDSKWEHHYRSCIEKADLVTCNSQEMARVLEDRTGVSAIVIPDPYEQKECPPRVHSKLLWFGHQSNLADVAPWVELPNLELVSNFKGVTQWSPEEMDRAFDRSGLVIIPTGKSMAKSANRAVESIRRGLYVVAGYLPAYGDLGIFTGNIADGVAWALSHKEEVLARIKASQDYIRTEYSPERVAHLWKMALEST